MATADLEKLGQLERLIRNLSRDICALSRQSRNREEAAIKRDDKLRKQIRRLEARTISRYPVEKFHRFSSLSVELQNLIWDFAIPAPKVVEVRRNKSPSYLVEPPEAVEFMVIDDVVDALWTCDVGFNNYMVVEDTSTSEFLSLLHTCQNSRARTLRAVGFAFGLFEDTLNSSVVKEKKFFYAAEQREICPGICFQPAQDTIFLNMKWNSWPEWNFGKLTKGEPWPSYSTASIRSLAITFSSHESVPVEMFLKGNVSVEENYFSGLEEFIWIIRENDDCWLAAGEGKKEIREIFSFILDLFDPPDEESQHTGKLVMKVMTRMMLEDSKTGRVYDPSERHPLTIWKSPMLRKELG